MINVRAITPPRGTLDPRKYEKALRAAQGKAEIVGLQELNASTRGWRKKPKFRIERKGDESQVVTDDAVFGYQDRGTKPHVIRPRKKRFLKFAGRSGTVYAKKVNHPGTPAQKFTEKAAAAVQRQYQRIMADELAKVAP